MPAMDKIPKLKRFNSQMDKSIFVRFFVLHFAHSSCYFVCFLNISWVVIFHLSQCQPSHTAATFPRTCLNPTKLRCIVFCCKWRIKTKNKALLQLWLFCLNCCLFFISMQFEIITEAQTWVKSNFNSVKLKRLFLAPIFNLMMPVSCARALARVSCVLAHPLAIFS